MRTVRICLALILTAGIMFIYTSRLYADDTSEAILKLLIKKGIVTQQEVDQIKAEIVKEKPEAPEILEERVAVLEEKVKEKGFLSLKGADFQLAGELEYEFVDTGGDGSDDNPHFQLDKFVLQPKVKIGDNLKLDAQLYFLESSTTLNEVHAKFSGLPQDSWIDVGLYERWFKSHHDRKTEGYPLLGTAFYRDDAMTLTWGGEYEPFYWMFSIGNGYELDDKTVGEDDGRLMDTAAESRANKILHDDHATSGLSESLEYGINLGVKYDFGKAGKADLLGFYYADELSSADRTFLQTNLPSYTSNDDDKIRTGLGIKYNLGNATLYGAYAYAEDGALDRDSWLLEASYHFKFDTKRDWFTGIEPIISNSDYDVDNTKATNRPLSWDRQKWIFGTIIDFYKNTKLKIEYYINDEDTGGGDGVSNDEFLAQLEIKF